MKSKSHKELLQNINQAINFQKKLLVIIPYRNRKDHLKQIIPFLNKKLREQKINFDIVVVEQKDDNLFNRGLLCNIGFLEYGYKFDYICFHDVDMIGDNIDYSYSDIPTSLIRYRSKLGNEKVFDNYFGGITIFPSKIFKKINGFDNEYWGWGAEDDDLKHRCELLDIETSYRNGTCEDLEIEPDCQKRQNNPKYNLNLNKIIEFKSKKSKNLVSANGLSNSYLYYKKIKKSKAGYKKIYVKTFQKSKENLFVFSSVGSDLSQYYKRQVFSSWEINNYNSACVCFNKSEFDYSNFFDQVVYKKGYKFPNFFYFDHAFRILEKFKYIAIMDDDLVFNQKNTFERIADIMDLYNLSICGINNRGKNWHEIMKGHSDELWITNFCEMGCMIIRSKDFQENLDKILNNNILDFGYDLLISSVLSNKNLKIGIIKNMSFYNPNQKERYIGRDLWSNCGIAYPEFKIFEKIPILD